MEFATLAFAVLNIIFYFLWWDKPLAVACSVPVHLRDPTTSEVFFEPPSPPLSHHPSAFARFGAYFCEKFKEKGLFALVYIFVIKPFMIILRGVRDMLACNSIPHRLPSDLSVPTFYAPDSPNHGFSVLHGVIFGVLFGGIHCIAWSFGFPSSPEEYIWRASAVAITTTPSIFYLTLDIMIGPGIDFLSHGFGLLILIVVFSILKILIVVFLIPVYCLSRAALLILPFLALRSLPLGSLLDFKWSSFIPHI